MREAILVVAVLFTVAFSAVSAQEVLWHELSTTFLKNHHQPRTVADAEAAGWIRINGCEDTRFAGNRYARTLEFPDMMLLYDNQGKVAGMQSVIPQEELAFSCKENVNEFYVHDVINGKELCLTTAYFVDPPASICFVQEDSVMLSDQLSFQMGEGFGDANLYKVPQTHDAAVNSEAWIEQDYFLGMGHHMTPPYDTQDCTKVKPFQAMYAEEGIHCKNSGFVWQHISKTPARDGWEKPPKVAVEMILKHPPKCILDGAADGLATTMHVFMGRSTNYCLLP